MDNKPNKEGYTSRDVIDLIDDNINTIHLPTVFQYLAEHMDLKDMIESFDPALREYYLTDWLSEIDVTHVPQYVKTECIVNDSNVVEILKAIANMVPGRCHTKEEYKKNICDAIDKYFIK